MMLMKVNLFLLLSVFIVPVDAVEPNEEVKIFNDPPLRKGGFNTLIGTSGVLNPDGKCLIFYKNSTKYLPVFPHGSLVRNLRENIVLYIKRRDGKNIYTPIGKELSFNASLPVVVNSSDKKRYGNCVKGTSGIIHIYSVDQ